MFNMHTLRQPMHRPSPIRTLLGILGISVGVIFFLQSSSMIPFAFDFTNEVYLKIFAGYAILSGIFLMISSFQQHGIIRY